MLPLSSTCIIIIRIYLPLDTVASAHDKLIVNKRPVNCRMLSSPWNRWRLTNWTCPAVRVGNVQSWLPWVELVLESCNMCIPVKVSKIPLTVKVGSKGEVHSTIGHEATEGSRAAVLNLGFTNSLSVDRLWGVHEFGWGKKLQLYFHKPLTEISRSQWPRGLRRRSTAVRLLRLWVRIPPGAWMFVCCECCVLSGRGLCDGLIPTVARRCVWSRNLEKRGG